jgi:hypothetical protein
MSRRTKSLPAGRIPGTKRLLWLALSSTACRTPILSVSGQSHRNPIQMLADDLKMKQYCSVPK